MLSARMDYQSTGRLEHPEVHAPLHVTFNIPITKTQEEKNGG